MTFPGRLALALCCLLVADPLPPKPRAEEWKPLNGVLVGCPAGYRPKLTGAVFSNLDFNAKSIDHGDYIVAAGSYLEGGEKLGLYCTTKAEDEQANRDLQFCKNNVSNPHPEAQTERDKWSAEIQQCLKDRAEFRRKKEH